jgi:hypothetical protein
MATNREKALARELLEKHREAQTADDPDKHNQEFEGQKAMIPILFLAIILMGLLASC